MDRYPFSPSAFQDGYSLASYPHFEMHGFRGLLSLKGAACCRMRRMRYKSIAVRSSKIKSSAEDHKTAQGSLVKDHDKPIKKCLKSTCCSPFFQKQPFQSRGLRVS